MPYNISYKTVSKICYMYNRYEKNFTYVYNELSLKVVNSSVLYMVGAVGGGGVEMAVWEGWGWTKG